MFEAIQMGRPTKYTSSAAQMNPEMNVASGSSRSSEMLVTAWYQLPSWKSLLPQQLVMQHAIDAVGRWLQTSRNTSLSPDSTVRELEQASSDVTGHDRDVIVHRAGTGSVQSAARDTSHQLVLNLSLKPSELHDDKSTHRTAAAVVNGDVICLHWSCQLSYVGMKQLQLSFTTI